jgi:hypothetical protein
MTEYYAYGFPSNFRNLADGGDFTINPWQRGASFTGITNSITYTADRWFAVGGGSSSISVLRQSISSPALPGFGKTLQFGRASGNANTAVITLGQVLETNDVIRLQGQQVTLSFWALVGANWSPATGALNVQMNSGTGTDEGSSSMMSGGWAGFTSLTVTPNQQNGAGQSTAAAANYGQSITNTAAWKQYSFTATIPSTATEFGFQFNVTPAGTAGANDWIAFAGVQLELGSAATAFEHRDIQVELEICQRYCWVIPEPANNVLVGVGGTTAAANSQNFLFYTPVQMRAAPSLSGFGSVTTGGFKVAAGGAAATATISAGTTHTANQITVTSAVTQSAGQVAHLQGGGGAGSIVASADL